MEFIEQSAMMAVVFGHIDIMVRTVILAIGLHTYYLYWVVQTMAQPLGGHNPLFGPSHSCKNYIQSPQNFLSENPILQCILRDLYPKDRIHISLILRIEMCTYKLYPNMIRVGVNEKKF